MKHTYHLIYTYEYSSPEHKTFNYLDDLLDWLRKKDTLYEQQIQQIKFFIGRDNYKINGRFEKVFDGIKVEAWYGS